MAESRLTHIDEHGAAHMVDVAGKPVTHRRAVACGEVLMQPETLGMIVQGRAPKGDVFAVARIAGIQAAKRTAELIPLCHPLPITKVSVELEAGKAEVIITAIVESDGKTGIEMEALTAVSVAALALYDMCKAVDRGMEITRVRLLEKSGGASGTWTREED